MRLPLPCVSRELCSELSKHISADLRKYNILYCGTQRADAFTLCEYIDEFYHTFGVKSCEININKVIGVLQSIDQKFPSPFGVDKSSPFKKVAAFTAYFAAEKPLHTALPEKHFGSLANHQNAVIAVALSIDALHGAVIKCVKRGDIVLDQRISLSKHYWKDLVAAASDCLPSSHFPCLSLIYEALAYQANPDASYDRII